MDTNTMTKTWTVSYPTFPYGEVKTFEVVLERYARTNGLCITLFTPFDNSRADDPEYDDFGPWATCTTNVGKLRDGLVGIKSYSENEGIKEALIEAKIIKPNLVSVMGMTLIYELTEEFQAYVKERKK